MPLSWTSRAAICGRGIYDDYESAAYGGSRARIAYGGTRIVYTITLPVTFESLTVGSNRLPRIAYLVSLTVKIESLTVTFEPLTVELESLTVTFESLTVSIA